MRSDLSRRRPVVLAMDPGFASFGVALVALEPKADRVLLMDVIRTKKSPRGVKVLASDDNYLRARMIAGRLRALVDAWDVVALCAESMSFPRNSSAAAKVALAWGVVADIAEQRRLPMTQASPQQIKKAVCGSGSASKRDVALKLHSLFPESLELCPGICDSEVEHPIDAVAAFVACRDDEMLRMARPRR